MQQHPHTTTIDDAEIERFSRMASQWWNPEGAFKPLHRMNPTRIRYILSQAAEQHPQPQPPSPLPLANLRLLDVGCGGGLITEPMARLGATVTGIDASQENIAVARLHAAQSGLAIDYRHTSAEALADFSRHGEPEAYDIVLALEIIEHVSDAGLFIASCAALLKPGGLLILSTLNRTAKSWALAIAGAEYLLRWLPRGTHDWRKFLMPHEAHALLRAHGFCVTDQTGMTYHPFTGAWSLNAKDLSVNYLIAART